MNGDALKIRVKALEEELAQLRKLFAQFAQNTVANHNKLAQVLGGVVAEMSKPEESKQGDQPG